MGLPSFILSIVDRNVVMRHMTVLTSRVTQTACFFSIGEDGQACDIKLVAMLRFVSLFLTLLVFLAYI